MYCADGNCFDTGYKKDTDFAKAISGIELIREAGQYPDEAGKIFKGFPATCNNKLSIGSEGNCCAARTAGGGQLSNYVALKTAVDVGNSLAGSTYAYDALFASDAPQWALEAFNTVFTSGGSNSALASLVAGDFSVSQYIQAVGPAIWLYVAIQVYSSWVQCEENDMKANLKRDSGLCHFVGSYCSSSLNLLFVKICLVNTQAYCCFNSKLAKIIQEQVRPQLGIDWGGGESPNCVGLDTAALQNVDWAKVDLSEFYSEIKAKMPAQTDLVQKSQQKYQNYFLQK